MEVLVERKPNSSRGSSLLPLLHEVQTTGGQPPAISLRRTPKERSEIALIEVSNHHKIIIT